MLQKEHNIGFRRDGQQPLPDTHEEVTDLVRFGLGFVRFGFAYGGNGIPQGQS